MQFIGLTPDSRDKLPDIQAYLDDFEIPWVNGYGAMSTLQSLGVQVLPTKLVVGRDGKVLWRSDQGGSLDEAIENALALTR